MEVVVVDECVQKSLVEKSPAPRPVRLMIATAVDGYWNLAEIFENELRVRGVPAAYGQQCLVSITKPQQISDKDINILYNACDIGLNTCEGEGFGLCQIEHAAVGHPQVAQSIGGLQDFLADSHSTLITPKWNYYIDKHRDGIGGIAEVSDPAEFAEAMWTYYTDTSLCEAHGKAARRYILHNYRWPDICHNLHNVIKTIAA